MNLEVQNSVFYNFSPLHQIALSWFKTGFCYESVCSSLSFYTTKSYRWLFFWQALWCDHSAMCSSACWTKFMQDENTCWCFLWVLQKLHTEGSFLIVEIKHSLVLECMLLVMCAGVEFLIYQMRH